ncbi:MAG: hypothetical protein IKL96_06770 [Kiritimatiellae bacterium]|nr:hypothetical protein [Kiritimatiellia bacterium]
MKITAQMHFAKALQQLRRQGVEPGDCTPDELYALAEAARRCADPFREVNADAAGFPVRVCEGVYFWRLTIGASVWLDEVGAMLGGGASPRYRLAMIHALVHSREPEAFAGLDTERKVMRAVRATMRTIHATPEEVNRALDAALGIRADARPRRADEPSEAAADWAALCARLESQTGIPAAEWTWKRSGAYAILAYNDLHEFARAYSGGRRSQDRLVDELDDAMNALRAATAAIEKRVKEARHG